MVIIPVRLYSKPQGEMFSCENLRIKSAALYTAHTLRVTCSFQPPDQPRVATPWVCKADLIGLTEDLTITAALTASLSVRQK